jgi:hypothetical protein
MKLIELTQGKHAQVDDEDFERVNKYNWHAHCGRGNKWYARSKLGGELKDATYLHVFIMDADDEIDHRDGDGLNCQKFNMRPATHSQNLCNRPTTSSTGYRGVQQLPSGRFSARLKQVYIGTFISAEEAARAVDAHAKESYGEFATLNFGDGE